MGVTIMGIATKADEKTVLNAIKKTFEGDNLYFDINFESEPFFESFINRKPSDNIIDLYSTNNGTICVLSSQLFEILRKEFLATFFDFVYFDICETSMSHRFALFSNGSEGSCMNIWDKGNSKRIAGDNFLDIKDDDDIFFNSFPSAINDYLPQSFHSIDLTTKIKRYLLIKNDSTNDVIKNDNKTHKTKKTFWERLFG